MVTLVRRLISLFGYPAVAMSDAEATYGGLLQVHRSQIVTTGAAWRRRRTCRLLREASAPERRRQGGWLW